MKLFKSCQDKSNIHLQKCQVVIIGCKCNLCGRAFKCVTDLKSHNKVHHFTNTQPDSDLPRIVTDFTEPDEKTSKFMRLIFKMGDEILAVKSVDRDCIAVNNPEPELKPCHSNDDENKYVNVEDDDGSDLELTRIELEEKYRELRALSTTSELMLKSLTTHEEIVRLPINSQVDSTNSVPDLVVSDDEIVVCYDSREENNMEADDCEIIYQSHVPSSEENFSTRGIEETATEETATEETVNSVTRISEEQVSSSSCPAVDLVSSLKGQRNEAQGVLLNGSELTKMDSHGCSGRKSNPFLRIRKINLDASDAAFDKNHCDKPQGGAAVDIPSPCSLEDLSEHLLLKRKRRIDEAIEPVEAKILRKNCLTIKCGPTGIRIEKSIIPMNSVDQENSTSENINSNKFLFIEKRKSSICGRPVSVASSLLSSVNR